MTNNDPQIDALDSAVKRVLDHAEFVLRVPALQREAAEFEPGLTDRGGLILKFPHDHRVSAYGYELATRNARRECDVDLKEARKRLRAARINYEKRVNFRGIPDIEWTDGGKFVALSAILEARAEAVFWHKIVREMATVERIKRANARNIERARPEFVTIAGEVYPVSK